MFGKDLLDFHRFLLADDGRTCSYRDAIRKVVRNGDVVLDLGAGTGILSFFACLAGASKIYAVEESDAIELARQICTSNGLDDSVKFLKDRSQNVALPEPVDLIVTEIGASFGLQAGVLGTVLDAKRRFLKPGGRIIPSALRLFVAPMELNDRRNLDIWEKNRYGLDLSSIRRFAVNNNYHLTIEADNLLGSPELLAAMNFEDFSSSYVVGEATCVARRAGLLQGLAAWISVELAPGISFTNSPLNPTVDWTQSFFPVETPVELQTGDSVHATFRTNDGQVWRWQVEVTNGGASSLSKSSVKARFDHSTLWNFPISKEQLKKRFPDYVPVRSRKGEAELYVLKAFNERCTISDLAAELLQHFADCFPSKAAASEFVNRLVDRCA